MRTSLPLDAYLQTLEPRHRPSRENDVGSLMRRTPTPLRGDGTTAPAGPLVYHHSSELEIVRQEQSEESLR